jgi:D-sedoheptulose 7-phosphate isomerase
LTGAERAGAVWSALVDESIGVREAMREALAGPLQAASAAVIDAVRSGRRVILFGNGGSAADAQHIAAELVGRYRLERRAWPAIALTENVSSLTGIGNDYGYEAVFARQLEALAGEGDVVIALSTSGTSPNVLRALEAAGERGLHRIVISGPAPNAAADLADLAVCIPAPTTAAVQEGYLLFLHALCHVVEETLAEDG